MGLFSFFKSSDSKSKPQGKKKYPNNELNQMLDKHKEDTRKADKEIETLIKASDKYDKDNDLDACIQVYESVLKLDKPRLWNNFNYCLKLVDLYLKADRRNDAWRFLNQMTIQAARDSTAPEYEICKIRYKQFGILKKEKKFLDALEMLSVYHVLHSNAPAGSQFNIDKYIKDANTTAKGAGLSSEQLNDLAQRLFTMAKARKGKATENE